MPGKLILFLTAFLLLSLLDSANTSDPVVTLQEVYQKADSFYSCTSPTNETDSLALAGFEEVITKLEKFPDRHLDSLLFQAYLRKGVLLDVKSKNTEAKNAYLKAAAMPKKNALLSDSLLFRVYIYVGSNYFNLNNFDSANYFLIKAEDLTRRFSQLPERERLYNTLGALNYVNGNYLQCRNYFSQALEIIQHQPSIDTVFALGLQANIATSSYKLGSYPEALAMYNAIIKQKVPAGYIYNGICMNMGKAYLAIKKYPEALDVLLQRCKQTGVTPILVDSIEEPATLALRGRQGRDAVVTQAVQPIGRRVQQAEDREQCGLAASRGPGNRDVLTPLDHEVDVVERVRLHLVGVEHLLDVLQGDQWR